MSKLVKRYRVFIIMAIILGIFLAAFPQWRHGALDTLGYQAMTVPFVLPPIFILLGLLDVWVPRESMTRYMGTGSGLRGPILAFLLGSFAAGPLYGAFPVASVLMKKGASFINIMIFIGAWSTTKIPMLLFEMSSLGVRFALSRLAIDIVGIVVIAFAISMTLPSREVERLYAEAEHID
ncbi:MAG TPA: permease [bacterium]|jgi:uncharacterized membrane protein YraQ (UPF0718 family)|nr:permease [bacterium]